jgi:hypothetical protein
VKTIQLAEHQLAVVVDYPDDNKLTFGDIESLQRAQRAVKIGLCARNWKIDHLAGILRFSEFGYTHSHEGE